MTRFVLRGGTVVDGTGGPSLRADVAVKDGRIEDIGDPDTVGASIIDVTGLVVAPGFVDIHTHYDAQLSWDPAATPSPMHGVTTIIGGNCGFSLAPITPDTADYIQQMMARVEGMPLDALLAGVDWTWTTYAEWLERFEGAIAVNAGFLVGHSTIRRLVMGEAATQRSATPAEVTAMAVELAWGLEAGGLGFSTSFQPAHSDGGGNPVPSRFAGRDEVLELCRITGRHPGTTVELVPESLRRFSDDEMDLLADMSVAADRPVNWNLLKVMSADPDGHLHQLRASDVAAERGGQVVALLLSQSIRPIVTFRSGFVLDGIPEWGAVMALPLDERQAALRDPSTVERLRAGAATVAGRTEAGAQGLFATWGDVEIAETHAEANRGLAGRTMGEIAAERNADPFDTLLDIVLADDLRTGLMYKAVEDDEESRRLRAETWLDPRTVIGGSDAGAHMEMMCGATYTTRLFSESVRDRQLLTLEEAVHQLTEVPARLYGLVDRGRLAPGAWADLVVFDEDTIDATEVRTLHDLPGGAPRLYAEAIGIEHVFVNGREIVQKGSLTGEVAGAVLRSGRDTTTVRPGEV